MALLDWLDDHSTDDLRTLVAAIEAEDLPAEQAERIRELIQDEPQAIREEAAQSTLIDPSDPLAGSVFGELEQALGLMVTAPPLGAGADVDVDVEEVDEDRQDALDRLNTLLEPAPGRGFEFFDELATALETGNAEPSASITQDTLDALEAEDRDELAERARTLAGGAAGGLTLDDFPGIQRAIQRGGGRDVVYFQNVLAELRGEQSAQRLPADELRQIQDASQARQSAIDRVEQHVAELQDGVTDAGADAGLDLGGPTPRPSMGPTGTVQDEDYITGESIQRNPQFEERFVDFARAIGRARDLDLFPLPPDDYFQLTPANQRKFYDVTPMEFMQRAINRGDVTRNQLINKFGFSEDEVP